MKKSKYIIVSVSVLVLLVISSLIFFIYSNYGAPKTGKSDSSKIISKDSLKSKSLLPRQDTEVYLNNRKVLIKIANTKNKVGTILVLHGWNLAPEEWCTKTSLCDKAEKEGYCLVLPDMGLSVYQSTIFPETRKEWRNMPTRKWLTDTLIPYLQNKYSLLVKNERNFIVGLSTGARGVPLVVLDLPDLFKGAAALSGDYDQSKMPYDNLMTGFYGSSFKFKKRWRTIDNVLYKIKQFNTPIYLGHGTIDNVCPPAQTKLFYDSLKKNHPKLKLKLNMPKAGHNYEYWASEVDNIFAFFNKIDTLRSTLWRF